ncbi:RsiV family protein [Breznakia pachnodae]|uniref:DUF3298 domain-containing protein n=1 Tax=Breznakia pachnodae TaxID=265178 RepID=A0ABU0E013_9FIRM|nr:RsiV family protein [Breznakia pachnodae]MDQ0360222.1 hypothetical protein [Breznakia pachnodae]
MRKLGIGILVLLVLLSGCSNNSSKTTSNKTENNDIENINFLDTYGLLKHLEKTNYEIVANIHQSDELKTIQSKYEAFLETNVNAYVSKSRYYYQYNDDVEFSDEYFYCYPILEENGYPGIPTINEIYKQKYDEDKNNFKRDYITLGNNWDYFYKALDSGTVSNKNSSTFHSYRYTVVSVEYTEPYVNLIFIFTFYQGGLHPVSYYSTETYDMNNGELVELENIFSDFNKDKKEIQELLQLEAKNIIHSPELIKLDDWYNKKSKLYKHDFIITKEGVQFLFDDYEIGAYAEGKQKITLKYSDIKQYLSEEFIESLEFEI